MSTHRPTPPTDSLKAIADFWDTHSLADYWDQTEPAEFDPLALDPTSKTDGTDFGPVTLKDYAESHGITLNADAYRREFPEDAPFTYPPKN